MFFKRKKAATGNGKPAAPQKRAAPSILGADLRIVGDLISDGEIQIDGNIDGDVRTRSLLLGKSAIVKGEVVAESVRVHGTVNGQIKAQSVILAKTARVVGNIQHGTLSIETGAYLEGHCTRMDEIQDGSGNSIKLVVKDAGSAATGAAGTADSAAPSKTDTGTTGSKVSPPLRSARA